MVNDRTIDDLLVRLDEIGDEEVRARLSAIAGRWAARSLRVLVVGEAKRGKSSVINALLRRNLLPTGVVPVTSVTTTVRHGPRDSATVEFDDGTQKNIASDLLVEFVSEQENPGNERRVRSVVVDTDSPWLAAGVELVDTPGTGSVNESNTNEARVAYLNMDAAIFVLTADPPISAAERHLLQTICADSVATFVVLNKADRMTDDELRQTVNFTRTVISRLTQDVLEIVPASAREPDGSGIEDLRTVLTDFLASRHDDGVLAAATKHLSQIVDQLLDEVAVALRALMMRDEESADRVGIFLQKLHVVVAAQVDAVDRLQGEKARILEELSKDAEKSARELTAVLHAEFDRTWAAQPRRKPAELERWATTWASHSAAEHAEWWRQERAENIQQRLLELDSRSRAELDQQIADIRSAAKQLLGVDLSQPPAVTALVTDKAFHYSHPVSSGEAAAMTALLRHRLPATVANRRITSQLHGRIDEWMPRHIGRARGDLQYRLTETIRTMATEIEARYGRYTKRLNEAVRVAQDSHERLGVDVQAYRDHLVARERELKAIRSTLNEEGTINLAPNGVDSS